MWGDEYQVLVATHLDTGTYHNHFVLNSVNMWDGKKFDCSEGEYWRFRSLSDQLCAEHGLAVIKNPSGKTPRSIYFAEKQGEPTVFNLMREVIDFSVSCARSFDEFKMIVRDQGYVVELNPNRKYWTIRSLNSKKAVRMYRLGENYTNESLQRRIYEPGFSSWQRNADYRRSRIQMQDFQPRRCRFTGSFKKTKKHTGLYALYLHCCYLLGTLPKDKQHRPLSPEMREAWRRLDRLSEQVRLLAKQKLNSLDEVQGFIADTENLYKRSPT